MLCDPGAARSIPSYRQGSQRSRLTTPSDFTQVAVPAKTFDVRQSFCLLVYLYQKPQTLFHRGPLGRQTRRGHSAGQQVIVDIDIRAHGSVLRCVERSPSLHIYSHRVFLHTYTSTTPVN